MTQYPRLVYNMTVLTVLKAAERQLMALTVAASQVVAEVVQLTSASMGPRSIFPFIVIVHNASLSGDASSPQCTILTFSSVDFNFTSSICLPTDACVRNAANIIATDRITFFILLILLVFKFGQGYRASNIDFLLPCKTSMSPKARKGIINRKCRDYSQQIAVVSSTVRKKYMQLMQSCFTFAICYGTKKTDSLC